MASDPDFMLAKVLQAEFNNEANFKRNKNGTRPPSSDSRGKDDCSPAKRIRPSASLVDPDWEVVDPTPDIHSLFVSFNVRFFWGALGSVEVRWSPRMYSCAGVCVYQGRRGMCSVRLSEPLLKLRPRSDLIETLLHEMIHAYLFVTHNNRDRDGHGPEFHKHMYRINKEAGTNITVYHSFHNEVAIYQKHWWRCDGPCQNKPPFFGMVKRSMNRAPGPNDFWWTTHQALCGGVYHKVREPEGTGKRKGAAKTSVITSSPSKKTIGATPSSRDIRNFFHSPTKKGTSGGKATSIPSSKSLPNINGVVKNITNGINPLSTPNMFGSQTANKKSNNVNSSKKTTSPSVRPVSGVIDLTDLSEVNDSNSYNKKTKSSPSNGTAVNNVVGFVDLTKKKVLPKKVFEGTGNKLGTGKPSVPGATGRAATGGAVMNRGTGTFVVTAKGRGSTPQDGSEKETNTAVFVPFQGKGQKLGSSSGSQKPVSRLLLNYPEKTKTKASSGNSFTNSKRIINTSCSSGSSSTSSKSCIVATDSIEEINGCNSSSKDDHVSRFNNSANTLSDSELAELDILDCNNDNNTNEDGDDDVKCPVCSKTIKRDDMSIHLESCDILNATLENMNNSGTLDDSDDDYDDKEEEEAATRNREQQSNSSTATSEKMEHQFPCPCCSKPIPESQINRHLDECLSLLALEEMNAEDFQI